MRQDKLQRIAGFLLGATLLCTRIANAQTSDRISAFDSEIKVDRDRTMHVKERFQISNDSGSFDKGFIVGCGSSTPVLIESKRARFN